jgi:hypothetical protein
MYKIVNYTEKKFSVCRRNQTKLCNVTKLLKNKNRAFPLLKSGNSVYVTNLEKSNLIANAFSNQSHDFNVSSTESEAVVVSIDMIRNSVIKLTPNVLVSQTENTSIHKNGWS